MRRYASVRKVALGSILLAGLLAIGLLLVVGSGAGIQGTSLAELASPGPDLIIQSIQLTPANPSPGQAVNIEVRVANIGNAAASQFTLHLYYDSPAPPDLNTTPSDWTSVNIPLNPGKNVSYTRKGVIFDTPGCSHVIWAWVDRDQDVIEDNENNNRLSLPFCVGATATPTWTPTASSSPTPTGTATPTPTATPAPCQPDSYEGDNSCATARVITTDGVHQMHSLCPVGDEDWVRFTAQEGVTYTLATANVGPDGDTVLALYNQCQQAPLAISDPAFGNGAELLWEAPASGEYFLKIKHHAASYGPNTGYELFITASSTCQDDSYETDDSCAMARDIAVGGASQRRQFCRAEDQDWAKFTAVSGATYSISTTHVGADADPVLSLYNACAFGPPLAAGQQLEFTAPQSGVYYVGLQNRDTDVFGATTAYDLAIEMTQCGPDGFEADDSAATARDLAPGAPQQAHDFCPAGDQDWVRFPATQGQLYVIETFGLGADADTLLCLFGPDGTTQIACDDDGGGGLASRLRWTAPAAGTYYLKVRNADNSVSGPTTSYDLAISQGEPLDSYESDNAAAQAKAITTDGTLQDRNFTPAGDQDWVRFDAVAGEPYVIQTLNLAGDCDTSLHLIDRDGSTELARNDDYGAGTRSQITYVFPQAGTYYAWVQHYRSNRSGRGTRYDLSVRRGVVPPTPTPTATPPSTPGPTSTPPASGIRTLIVTNRERLEALYGLTAATSVMDHLALLASDAGVRGLILQAEADSSALTAYALWNSNPISTTLANNVSGAVRNQILTALTTNPSVEYIVLVGNDQVVPFRRIPDRTRHPESYYVAFVTGGTSIWAAMADGMTLTDDYYADREPSVVNHQEVYVPDYAIGRLPEGASEIVAYINAFLAQGQIDLQRVLVTGYDFVVDTGQTISQTVGADLGPDGVVNGSLMGEWWQATALRDLQLSANPPFNVQFINGHANHHLQGAPTGGGVWDSDITGATAADLNRSLIVTLGCHSGLNEVGSLPAGLDLAQAFFGRGATYIANTGYGWGSNAGLGWSERLVRNYVEAMTQGASVNIGKAMEIAKQRFYGEASTFDAYDEKAMMESTLYGLPHYQLVTGGLLGPDDPFPSVQITMTLPLDSGPVNIAGLQFGLPGSFGALDEHETTDGSFFAIDQHTQVIAGQPVQPQLFADVSRPTAGKVHGVIMSSGHYTEVSTLDPVVAQPVNEWIPPAEWAEPSVAQDGWLPGRPVALQTQLGPEGSAGTLLAQLGQYNGQLGHERLYDAMSLDVYYSDSPDWTGPVICYVGERLDAQLGRATVKVEATDVSGLLEGRVTYTQGDGRWQSVNLTYNAGMSKWLAEIPAHAGTHYYVQMIDRAGNVTVADNKGHYYGMSLSMSPTYLPLLLHRP